MCEHGTCFLGSQVCIFRAYKITDNISFTSSGVCGRTAVVDTTFMSCAQYFHGRHKVVRDLMIGKCKRCVQYHNKLHKPFLQPM